MPAPDLVTIYQFERHIELALQAHLDAAGIDAVIKQGDNSKVARMHTAVRYEHGSAVAGAQQIVNGTPEWTAYDSALRFTVLSERRTDHASTAIQARIIDDMLARVRVSLMQCNLGDLNGRLDYHLVRWIRPGAVSRDTDEELGFDVTTQTFDVRIEIRKSAWPVATP